MTSVIGRIAGALDMTAAIVRDIAVEQLDSPSLCEGWDVRAELSHLVGGMRIFTAELNGVPAGADHDADWLGDDPHRAYAEAAAADRAAWQRPGVLDATVQISLGALPGPMAAVIHLTEVVVHGTDLAVATGRPDRVDQRQCAELLATMHSMGGMDPYRVPGMFGPDLAAPADATPSQRLLAYLGRAV